MSKLSDIFKNEKALITYITAGDPSIAATSKLFRGLEKIGVNMIEIGVPFSDSLADGPVIQGSHLRALKKGTSVRQILDMVKKLRKRSKLPIVLMSSANPLIVYGLKKLFIEARELGINGFIIPDLPPEEAGDFLYLSEHYGVDLIFLVSTLSSDQRLKMIVEKSTSFVYLMSTPGITGEKSKLEMHKIRETVDKIKGIKDIPVAVGFGISTVEQVEQIFKFADGVIIGSAVVKRAGSRRQAVGFIKNILRKLDE